MVDVVAAGSMVFDVVKELSEVLVQSGIASHELGGRCLTLCKIEGVEANKSRILASKTLDLFDCSPP